VIWCSNKDAGGFLSLYMLFLLWLNLGIMLLGFRCFIPESEEHGIQADQKNIPQVSTSLIVT